MTDFEKICNYHNLYKAHLRARSGKRNRTEVILFEMNLAANLSEMYEALCSLSYRMKGYYSFTIHEPKQRTIYAAYYPDRVLLHCICDEVLAPLLQNRLIYDNAACQVNKGTHFAMNRISKFMREHYCKHGTQGYFLKCDISKYFASIDHQILKQKLDRIIADKKVMDLLSHFIDSYSTEGYPGKGIPLGNQSSQLFAIYYMDSLDRYIKEVLQVKYYTRYMDDMILLHHDKQFLKDALVGIQAHIEENLKLTLNDKTQIFPVRNGVAFLGWRFYLSETGKVIKKLRTGSKIRYKKQLKNIQKRDANGEMDIQGTKRILSGFYGHLIHGHTYKLRQKVMTDFVLQKKIACR